MKEKLSKMEIILGNNENILPENKVILTAHSGQNEIETRLINLEQEIKKLKSEKQTEETAGNIKNKLQDATAEISSVYKQFEQFQKDIREEIKGLQEESKIKVSSIEKDLSISKELINSETIKTQVLEKKLKELFDNMDETNKQNVKLFTQLMNSLEKKPSEMDLKKMSSSMSDTNSQIMNCKKQIEMIQQSIISLEKNEDLNLLKLKFNSLDTKIPTIVKNIKDLEIKILENLGPTMPQQMQGIDEGQAEEIIRKHVSETSEKITSLKISVQNIAKDYAILSNSIETKLDSRATVDSLIELENKLYKDIDKIVLNITSKLSGDDSKKGYKLLKAQVNYSSNYKLGQ